MFSFQFDVFSSILIRQDSRAAGAVIKMQIGHRLLDIRVSHITPFFELSYTLLTTHAIGLYEVTKKISAL